MNNNSITKRGLEVLGLLMIGEGIVGLIRPRRYSLLWKVGPTWLRDSMDVLAAHRDATRLLCAAEIAAGLWLALREIEEP